MPLQILICVLGLLSATPSPVAIKPAATILITHPRAEVLQHYLNLAEHHLLDPNTIHLRGIYHREEQEDYSDAVALLRQQKIGWIDLHPIDCPLDFSQVYQANHACREVFAQLLAENDGLILNGGPDIPPILYNAPQLLTTWVTQPKRNQFEIALAAQLIGSQRNRQLLPLMLKKPNFPILGICMGLQTLNVAAGGSLIQDIPSQLYGAHTIEEIENGDPNTMHSNPVHARNPDSKIALGHVHPILLTADAPAWAYPRFARHPLLVLSIHHQSIKNIAPDFQITATSLDHKVIEGIHHRRFKHVIGWQFHPERTELWDNHQEQRSSPAAAVTNAIFQTIAQDPTSEAFNAAIWADFTAQLTRTLKSSD